MLKPADAAESEPDWDRRSLPEVHGTIPIPVGQHPWKKMLAFAGPGYLVAVGYMDPGNWATDIAGGAKFGYTLLSVIMLSNLMAILLQSLAARLGIASGRDLAQACRDTYSPRTSFALWTATSTRPASNARSIAATKAPSPQAVSSTRRSPSVSMMTIRLERPVSSRASWTSFAWARARALPREPMATS